MKINLYVVNNCPACSRAKLQISSFVSSRQNIQLKITNLQQADSQFVSIVPALYINEKLYSYGEINENRLDNFIRGLN